MSYHFSLWRSMCWFHHLGVAGMGPWSSPLAVMVTPRPLFAYGKIISLRVYHQHFSMLVPLSFSTHSLLAYSSLKFHPKHGL